MSSKGYKTIREGKVRLNRSTKEVELHKGGKWVVVGSFEGDTITLRVGNWPKVCAIDNILSGIERFKRWKWYWGEGKYRITREEALKLFARYPIHGENKIMVPLDERNGLPKKFRVS